MSYSVRCPYHDNENTDIVDGVCRWCGRAIQARPMTHGGARRGAGGPIKTGSGWLWVSTPHATFALQVEQGIVVEPCPPYARRWALGRRAAEVQARYRGRPGCRMVWHPGPDPWSGSGAG